MADKQHVVIVGAGFGGVHLAKELAKEKLRITLVDQHNYHLFQPLLYQVSTAVLSAGEIAYPTREFFKRAVLSSRITARSPMTTLCLRRGPRQISSATRALPAIPLR